MRERGGKFSVILFVGMQNSQTAILCLLYLTIIKKIFIVVEDVYSKQFLLES